MRRFHFLLLSLVLVGCQPPQPTQSAGDYDFQHPDMIWSLPEALREVSGIAVDGETGNFRLVQDEVVHIYEFERSTGGVKDLMHSGKDGDIEDLAYGDSKYVLLQSDGLLWVWGADSLRTVRVPLPAKSDAEGLCYAPESGKWLIAIKSDLGLPEPDRRTVYAYDFETDSLEVYLEIDLNLIASSEPGQAWLTGLPVGGNQRIRKPKGPIDDLFAPSGIALHPQTGDCYLISAKSALLAIYDAGGVLRQVHALPREVLPKAEGISFTPDGKLYLCSEAKAGKRPNVAVFYPKR